MTTELKSKWVDLSSKYTEDKALVISYWDEIVKHYSGKNRYYHNLSHIQNMLSQAENFKDSIFDFDILLFAIWYHDIIYKPTKKNNEEKSGILAKKRLKSLSIGEKRTINVLKLISSTKNHNVILSKNEDNAYLLDFDLAILGTDWETYKNYTQNIRKEYWIYPDFMYKSGRKKVLQHFLKRDTLYFTETYITRFEKQARKNLKKEIELL
ncbi:hypothetical protein [Winogradskyella sp.]|uniref:HD domain-containing protein n=1 Tax=Winogradskyella sp. TaxID=1883156 RepID=UPI003BAA8AA9